MSSFDTIIRQSRILTSDGWLTGDLGIAEGKIAALASSIGEQTQDDVYLPGAMLVPGMIDSHAHFNEPGRTEWEGFATGTLAAAAGGVTTVFDMPLNSFPATLTPEALAEKRRCAAVNSRIKTRFWGGLVPGNLDCLPALHAGGVIGFKAFMSHSGIDDFPRSDSTVLRRGMKVIAGLPGMCLAVHAEDEGLTARLSAEARAAGRISPLDFAASRPIEAELLAIREVLDIAGEVGCPLHIVHVTCAEGVALVSAAKNQGVDVTVESCPHYLTLTTDDLERLGVLVKCAPPLRSTKTQEGLWAAVARGEVDTIGSDHSPCPPQMKSRGSFWDAWGGISGIQHALPLVYSQGLEHGLPGERIAAMLSSTPALRFHLGPGEGVIRIGSPADLCLLVPSGELPIQANELLDRYRHSPYVGRNVDWKVARTWVDGRGVFCRW